MRRNVLVLLLLSGVLWLAVPAVASADNCGAATTAELKFKDCYDRLKNTVAGWMGFAAGAAAGWLASIRRPPKPRPPDDEADEESDGDDLPPELFRPTRRPPSLRERRHQRTHAEED